MKKIIVVGLLLSVLGSETIFGGPRFERPKFERPKSERPRPTCNLTSSKKDYTGCKLTPQFLSSSLDLSNSKFEKTVFYNNFSIGYFPGTLNLENSVFKNYTLQITTHKDPVTKLSFYAIDGANINLKNTHIDGDVFISASYGGAAVDLTDATITGNLNIKAISNATVDLTGATITGTLNIKTLYSGKVIIQGTQYGTISKSTSSGGQIIQ